MPTLKANLNDIFEHHSITKQWDSDDNPNLLLYADEAAGGFVREYSTSVAEEGQDPRDIAEVFQEDIDMAVQQNVGRSMWERSGRAAENALEELAQNARVPLTAKFDPKKGNLSATFDGKAMLRAWREEVKGQGYAGWGGDEKVDFFDSDIKSLKRLIGILDSRAEVYGTARFKRLVSKDMDGFEPDTGSYSQLAKIADKAIKKK